MHVNRKWCLFPFAVPSWRHQICIVSVRGSVLSLMETIFRKICANPLPKNALRTSFPVDVRRSKTSLLKLSNDTFAKSEYGQQNQENCNKLKCPYCRVSVLQRKLLHGFGYLWRPREIKCSKWKTCLCYGGNDCIKFGTFTGLWSYIQWYVGLWVHWNQTTDHRYFSYVRIVFSHSNN